ncbi:DnaJ-domain-containing protein [Pisolithus marmoratus]|nr:DnaJ-domain-containing protein [Pisolithus marmoratus]
MPTTTQSPSHSKPVSLPSQSRGPTSRRRPADSDLEQLLSREASAFQREMEVERILKSFRLNTKRIPVLNTPRPISQYPHIPPSSAASNGYAFDILKKAEAELSDTTKREELDAAIASARSTLLRSLSLPTNLADDDPRLRNLADDPKLKEQGLTTPWKIMMKEKIKEVLIEEEVRRRKAIKMNLANEGLEARKKEEEVAAKKRKAEED